jgi:hypothetical protein
MVKFLLEDKVPIVITSRYGQNMEITPCSDVDMDEILLAWKRDLNIPVVHYITFAVASHVQ